ncbi:hypothetical protein QIH85_43100 [Bradyrhizobium japonicum]|uniref:hypothetical protein n=1 Tax=Bradyrhizobium japonicum TaxID=375 RepID=UPI001E2A259B|nr:hypothetical protein [Bradyrhizobium japonicum]MCD9898259.1 hypothetical protein [Bradyrhizobium japonicum]WLB28520.1 hypothetical protein QIH85_43100 [Bradyrhizobium japonicum]WRJ84726.1 hypothetical protein R3F78_07555 [Bradyrhizobium japonicum]WRJ93696.1 hypothetical protein R3F77_05265 [Bradyrhizobium japonicum]WRK47548.1 hypothetical protein R3F73_05325 [Bradyrhizobium japonicum]
MEEYSVYLLGPDGQIVGRINLVCANEDAAKERAWQLAQDCTVELTQGERSIAVYRSVH